MPILFYVTKDLPVSVFLGWDWIKENDLIIRQNASTVSILGDSVLTVMSQLQDPEPVTLNLMTDEVMYANTIAQCTVYVPNMAPLQLAESQLHLFLNDDSESPDQLELEMYVVPHPDL